MDDSILMEKARPATGVGIVLLCCLIATTAKADPFASYPGVRAQGMAGTMTALEDIASVWYNPAAIAFSIQGGTVEWKQAASMDELDDSLGSKGTLFGGYQQSLGKWTAGLFYFQPYTMSYGAQSISDSGKVSGKVNATYQSLSMPVAVSAMKGKIKMGASLDWVTLDTSGSTITVTENSSNPKNPGTPVAIEVAEPGGFAVSLGALVEVLDHQPWNTKVRIGGVYRSQSMDDPSNAESSGLVSKLIFGKPSSLSLGVSADKSLADGQALIGALQLDYTRWSSDLAYQKVALGMEFVDPLKGTFDLTMAYRLGWYQSSPSEGDAGLNWPDVTGFTGGVGVQSREDYQLNMSIEQRSTEEATRNDDSNLYLGFSLTFFI